jgi:hypothetical protein
MLGPDPELHGASIFRLVDEIVGDDVGTYLVRHASGGANAKGSFEDDIEAEEIWMSVRS